MRHQSLLVRITKLALEFRRLPHGSLLSVSCRPLLRLSSVEMEISERYWNNLVSVEIAKKTLSLDTCCFVR